MAKTQASINKFLTAFGVALSSVAIAKIIKSSTQMAMTVESSMDNIHRNMGKAAESYNTFVKTQSKALGMARKDAYAYGSTFSNLLGSFLGDTQQVASETQNLMKAAAVISSKTGRTYEDVSNRIRSGMLGSTEAIEDLGIYTQVSMLESTEAFKKFANGKTWNQLAFQQQQQIRLAAILEQTYKRYGDTLADTTQTKQARFLASLENIKLNLGQAFLPVYNAVLPALTALANKLEEITSNLAAFSESIFGKATSIQAIESQTEAITDQGNAIEKAGKQAKRSIAGFDQLNILTSSSSAAGGGGSNAIQSSALEDLKTTTRKLTDEIDSIFDKLQKKFPTIFALGKERAQLTKELMGVIDDIASVFRSDTAKQIGKDFQAIFSESFGFILEMSLRFGNDFMKVIITTINNNKENLKSVLNDTLSATQTVTSTIRDFLGGVFQHIRQTYDKYVRPAIDNFGEGFNTVFTKVSGAYAKHLGPTINEIAKQFSELVKEYVTPLAEEILNFGGSVTELISQLYKHISPFVGWIGSFVVIAISNALRSIWEIFEFVYKIIATRLKALFGVLHGLTEFLNGAFSGDWDRAWNGIRKILDSWWEGVTSLFDIVKDTIKDNFGDALEGAKNLVGNGLDTIKVLFSSFMERISIILSPFKGIVEGLGDTLKTTFKGAINGVISQFNKFIGWVNSKMKFSWDGLKIAGKTIFEGGSVQLAKIPTIPQLAKGGIVDSPTLAMIGEKGTEAVVPLENTSFVTTIAKAIAGEIAKTVGNIKTPDNNGDVVIRVGESDFARIAIKAINEAQRSAGTTLLIV